MVAAALLWFGTSASVSAHPGGTDESGCHAGSQPRHCHNSVDSATVTSAGATKSEVTNPGEGTAGVSESTAPVVKAPQAGSPDTTTPPVVPAPTPEQPTAQTPPPSPAPAPAPEVLAAQETQQPNDALAQTGLTEDTYYLALGLLLLGLTLITTSGLLGYVPQPLKGGFTYRTFNRGGDPVVIRTTTGG